jgi:uncharacterized protein YaaR (DUF327 family)
MKVPEPTGKYGEPKINMGKAKKAGEKRPAKGVFKDSVYETNFLKELESASEEQIKRSLDELIEEIDKQAQILEKHRTFEELEKYRRMVRDFMDQAIKKIYSVKVSESSKFMIKRKKVFVIVEKVNAELEELAKKVLSKQAQTMDLLASLEKIKGLLVDMYS